MPPRRISVEGHAFHASVICTLITISESLPGLLPDQPLRAFTSPELSNFTPLVNTERLPSYASATILLLYHLTSFP